jgi:hypothetical protein
MIQGTCGGGADEIRIPSVLFFAECVMRAKLRFLVEADGCILRIQTGMF